MWDDIEVNTKDKAGRSLLSYAVQHGCKAVVKILVVQDDVEVNTKDTCGCSPLSYATKFGHEVAMKILAMWDDERTTL